jgi:Family of unknown function (DUF5723)
MNNYSFWLAAFLSFGNVNTLLAQAQLGLRTDNYAGIQSLSLNPASIAASYPLGWDLNLFSGGFNAGNNILFVKDAHIFTVKNNWKAAAPVAALKLWFKGTPSLYYDFYNDDRPKFFAMTAEAMAPSFALNLESGHSFGVFGQMRAQMSGYRLPHIANRYRYMTYPEDSIIHLEPFKMAGMVWGEIGFNYGRQFELNDHYISIGLTIKKLWGYQSFYVENRGDTRMTKLYTDSLRADAAFIEGGITTSAQSAPYQPTGTGFSADFGAVFIPNGTPTDYKIKYGISLHDLGNIRFTDSAEWHTYDNNNIHKAQPFKSFKNIDKKNMIQSTLRNLDRMFVNADNTTATLKARAYNILLPARLQLFADYRVANLESFGQDGAFFVHGLWMQPIRMAANQTMSDALLAVTPRYETRWWSVSLPISVYNWQQTRWGLSVRAAFLTLGSDYMSSLFYKGRLDGTDFYMSLKVNPFTIGKLGKSSSNRRGKAVKCYRF